MKISRLGMAALTFTCSGLAGLAAAQARTCDRTSEDVRIGPSGGIRDLTRGFALTMLLGGGNEDAERGWLGVRLDAPGPALAAQLDLGERGLLVVNVCENSPADLAGLQQYDVILNFAGHEVARDAEELGRRIRELGPGTEVELVVLRRGAANNLKTTLATWPDESQWTWRYEDQPETLDATEISLSGKIFRVNPDGSVAVDHVPLPDVPEQFRALLPNPARRSFEVWNEDGRTKLRAYAVEGSVLLQIERHADNHVHVCRTTIAGGENKCEEKIYENEEALREGDELAYRILKEYENQQAVSAQPPSRDSAPAVTPAPPAAPTPSVSDVATLLKKIEGLDDQTKQELLWKNISPILEKEHLERQQALKKSLGDEMNRAFGQLQERWFGASYYSFEVVADGSVKVVKRKGDSELRMSFTGFDDMEKNYPALYDRYRSLQSSE